MFARALLGALMGSGRPVPLIPIPRTRIPDQLVRRPPSIASQTMTRTDS